MVLSDELFDKFVKMIYKKKEYFMNTIKSIMWRKG